MQEANWTIVLFSNKSDHIHLANYTWPTIQIPHQPNQPTRRCRGCAFETPSRGAKRPLSTRQQRWSEACRRSIRRSAGECDRRRRRLGPTTRKAAAGTGIVALIAALVASTIMFTIMKRKPTSPGPPHQAAPRAGLDGGLRPQVRQLARAPITTWSRGFTASGEVSFSRGGKTCH